MSELLPQGKSEGFELPAPITHELGAPQSRPLALWGKEEQGSGCSFRRQAETKPSGLCNDADAPSAVTSEQLAELHIAVTAIEEE